MCVNSSEWSVVSLKFTIMKEWMKGSAVSAPVQKRALLRRFRLTLQNVGDILSKSGVFSNRFGNFYCQKRLQIERLFPCWRLTLCCFCPHRAAAAAVRSSPELKPSHSVRLPICSRPRPSQMDSETWDALRMVPTLVCRAGDTKD